MQPTVLWILSAILFLSGTSSLINQVVWQRALKIYLGGSEAISSLTVVLVFMVGLCFGALAATKIIERRRIHPLLGFVICEFLLFVFNCGVLLLLSADIQSSVFSFQRAALLLGVPLRLLYAASAMLILLIPCGLMGANLPFFLDHCQSRLGYQDKALVPVIFFVNTLGATVGTAASGLYLMPILGQKTTLLLAATGNLIAAVVAIAIGFKSSKVVSNNTVPLEGPRGISQVEGLGFLNGFLSLAYQILLLRVFSLIHHPLPSVFAVTLCFYLFAWSMGVYLSSKKFGLNAPSRALYWCAFSTIALGIAYSMFRWKVQVPIYFTAAIFTIPCFFSGLNYGQLIQQTSKAWGRDVGRFHALNTLGCCAGIFAAVFGLYRFDIQIAVFVTGIGFAAMWVYVSYGSWSKVSWWQTVGLAGLFVLLLVPFFEPLKMKHYVGEAGVVEVDPEGNLIWDGLWHSKLANGHDYLGRANWMMAVVPVMAHSSNRPVKKALVVGLGSGITAGSLAMVNSIESIVVYDTNPLLKNLIADFPEGTLNVASNPKIRMVWQDGRTGLALDETKYDIITSQPLYLKQAGSSILLSEEYLRLVKSRLEDGGVFCLYSNAIGSPRQGLLVRNTFRKVFDYYESFHNGYMLVGSNQPLDLSREAFEAKLTLPDTLMSQALAVDRALKSSTHEGLYSRYDFPKLNWTAPPDYIVTDDSPLVEYPGLL